MRYLIKNNTQQGIAALFTVIVISAAALMMAYGASLLGLGELDSGYTMQKGEEAFWVADGCMEEALGQFRLNSAYTGGALTVSNGSCIIGVTSFGSSRTIVVTGTSGQFNKKMQAGITLPASGAASIIINSWQEKTD